MGVRGKYNIRVVKNKNIGPVIIEPKSSTRLSFLINRNNLKKADLINIKRDLVEKDNLLDNDDVKIFNIVWDLVKKHYNPNFISHLNFINKIYDILVHNAYYPHELDRQHYPLLGEEELLNALMAMNLLIERNGKYYNSELATEFVKTFEVLGRNIPFDCDNFVNKKYFDSKLLFAIKQENAKSTHIEIDDKEYTLFINGLYQEELNEKINRSNLFVNIPLLNNQQQNTCSLDELLKTNSEKLEILKYLSRSVSKSNVEMLPISSGNYYSLLQGTVNGQSFFASINNSILNHCYNAYGKDLEMILDYDGMSSGIAQSPYEGRLHIFSNNSLVYSCTVDTRAPIASSSEQNGQIFFNTLAVNIKKLKDSVS